MAGAELVTGAVVGSVSSLIVGSVLLFARRNHVYRDRTEELARTLAALSRAVQYIEKTVDRMDEKLDGLPCHNYCPPGERDDAA